MDPNLPQIEKTPLHEAARAGDLSRVRLLLETGGTSDINTFDELGWTPLMCAAVNGHVDVVRVLLQAGADVNANDESTIGNTVLRQIVGNASYEMVRLLVDAGADPTIPGWMQLTALHIARDRKDEEGKRIIELLEERAKT